MDGFDFDDLEDLVEADIQYGLFEDDDKQVQHQRKNNLKSRRKKEIKTNWIYLKFKCPDQKSRHFIFI